MPMAANPPRSTGTALRQLVDAPPLIAAAERFGTLYQRNLARRYCWRLGVEPQGTDPDSALVSAANQHMRDNALSLDALFFAHRAGRNAPDGALGEVLRGYKPAAALDDPIWAEAAAPTNHIDEVERIWAAIATGDDWGPLMEHVSTIRRLGNALGEPPLPAGH